MASRSTVGTAFSSSTATPTRSSVFPRAAKSSFGSANVIGRDWANPFNHPTDVAVAPDGEIYVSDGYGNGRVHVFDPSGALRLSFGAVGHAAGEFMTPHALLIDRQNRVVVADRENNRVQRFDRDGNFLNEMRGLCRPMDVFERADGVLLVTDVVPSVNAFAEDGARVGRGRPSLQGAHGITGDSSGTLYLAEIEPNSISCLRPMAGLKARPSPLAGEGGIAQR